MVGGAHGLLGHHVRPHVMVAASRPGNGFVTTPFHQRVELIVLVTVANNKLAVVLYLAQVRCSYHMVGNFREVQFLWILWSRLIHA